MPCWKSANYRDDTAPLTHLCKFQRCVVWRLREASQIGQTFIVRRLNNHCQKSPLFGHRSPSKSVRWNAFLSFFAHVLWHNVTQGIIKMILGHSTNSHNNKPLGQNKKVSGFWSQVGFKIGAVIYYYFFGNLFFFCQPVIYVYVVIGTRPHFPYTKYGG